MSVGFSFSTSENRLRYQAFKDTFFYACELESRSPPASPFPMVQLRNSCSLICQWPPGLPQQVMPILPVPRRVARPRDVSMQIARTNPVIPVFEKPAISEKEAEQPPPDDQTLTATQNSGKQPKTKNRTNFTPQQRQLLEKFFYEHLDHPYADHRDLEVLEKQTNLSKKQIRIFMTNARMRKFAKYRGPIPRGRRPMGRQPGNNNLSLM